MESSPQSPVPKANDYVPKNILITGAGGFIGSHVALRLINKFPMYKVVVLDKLDYCANPRNLAAAAGKPNFKFIKGDIQGADLVNHVLITEEIDTIMHFAAQTHVDNSFGNSLVFTRNNIAGTHTLLEASKARGDQIKRFIHVSTDEVYGENSSYDDDQDGNTEERTPLDPTNPYAATKAGAEMLVKSYSHSYGLPVIITRGNNVYGPHQFPEKLIPKMIMMASKGMSLPIHGNGMNKRSYLYVEDVAEAFDVILHKGTIRSIYNIGTTIEQTVKEVVTEVAKSVCPDKNPDDLIQYVPDRAFNDMRYYLDVQKLTALGWNQRTLFAEGLRKTVEWYMATGEEYWAENNLNRVLVAHPRISSGEVEFSGIPTTKAKAAGNGVTEFELITGTPRAASGAGLGPFSPSPSGSNRPMYVVFGRTGWIGGEVGRLLQARGADFCFAECRLQERENVAALLRRTHATHVINCAGVTGRPNVDWCEDHQVETIRANVIGCLTLADICETMDIHMTNFATGCIFHYDETHPMYPDRDEKLVAKDRSLLFNENDCGNFKGSYYSKTKGYVEDMLRAYQNVLTLRVRMPIDAEILTNKRNFIYKIAHYNKVVDIPNSMTVLPELLPFALDMADKKKSGIYNFANPGGISHNQVLELYKMYIDPEFTWNNFTIEEQAEVIKAGRSNVELDPTKFWAEAPDMLPIRDSLVKNVFLPNQTEASMKAFAENRFKAGVYGTKETMPVGLAQVSAPSEAMAS